MSPVPAVVMSLWRTLLDLVSFSEIVWVSQELLRLLPPVFHCLVSIFTSWLSADQTELRDPVWRVCESSF